MAFYTGCTGAVIYNSKPVAKVRDWTLDMSVELIEVSTIDDCSTKYSPGRKTATGSATLYYYRLETGESATYTQFTELLSRIHKIGDIEATDRVLLTLKVGNLAEDDIQFYAYITNASITVNTNEITQVAIQFTVDGDFLAGGVIA